MMPMGSWNRHVVTINTSWTQSIIWVFGTRAVEVSRKTAGRRDHRRAYAWIRAALALGVPQDDYDATVFKLGIVVGKLGIARLGSADRLATGIVEEIISRRKSQAQVHAQDAAIAKFP
jgi:hypothetical protein